MLEASTSGPRPLQLVSGYIITPSSRNATRPVSVPDTTSTQVEDAHQTHSLYTPPSSARPKGRSSSRRHSSISYIHSGTRSKSPLSQSQPTSPQFPPVGQLRSPGSHLSRNKSLSGPVPGNVKAKRNSIRSSYGPLTGDSNMADAMKHLKERPPVTLTEKHAELLHFIAQKESKCLELRSQLAMHEAELLQLKRKWELIVNRGFERSQTWSSTLSPSPPSLSPSVTSAPHTKSPLTSSSPYFPLLPGSHAHAPVLEGIKEGVQGMSRLIAAGFESIAGVPIEPSHAELSSHQPPLQLLMHSTSKLDRKQARRHAQNESQSSISTVNSTSTFASESAGATNTSATSIRSSFSFDGPSSVTASQTSTLISKNEQGVKEGKNSLGNLEEQSRNNSPVSDRSEQVLMVRDTGATPTMSPNPDFERKRRSKTLNERQGGEGSPVKRNTKHSGDFDPCLGGYDELSPPREHRSPAEAATTVEPLSKSPPSLPPISTIPGLATMNLAGPAAQQVTSWMGSVGKRLGEIRDSSTFTKSQKRASLLLTDMQNSFVSSLISLPPPSSSPSLSGSASKDKHPIIASNTLVSHPTSAFSSLLDELDDGEMTGGPNTDMTTTTRTLLTTPVLVPSVRKSPDTSVTRDGGRLALCLETTGSKGGSESDDDWNW